MSKLFEAVDQVDNFINESIWAAYEVPVTSIELYYGNNGNMTHLNVALINAFNILEIQEKTTMIGYLILPANDDTRFNAQGLNQYLERENITQIIVNLKDGTICPYFVSWNSSFDNFEGISIMVFECKKQ